MKEIIESELFEHLNIAKSLPSLTNNIEIAVKYCIDCLKNGGKILLIGNGGSAADAQHIAAELVGRYKVNRRSLPAISLTTDTSILTSIANDFGFENVFDRQIQAFANHGDVVIGISTSGQSKNVISALKLAKKLNCITIGLSGKRANKINDICDIVISAPSSDTPRIQETHILIGHIICHLIDNEFQD